MGVSKNMGFYPQIIQFNRVFHEINHPFWDTTVFGNTHIYPKQPGVFLSSYDSKAGNKNLEDFALSFLRKARWKCVQSRKIWPSPSKGNVKGGKMRNMLIMLCFYLPKSDSIVYSISMSIYLLREYL